MHWHPRGVGELLSDVLETSVGVYDLVFGFVQLDSSLTLCRHVGRYVVSETYTMST